MNTADMSRRTLLFLAATLAVSLITLALLSGFLQVPNGLVWTVLLVSSTAGLTIVVRELPAPARSWKDAFAGLAAKRTRGAEPVDLGEL